LREGFATNNGQGKYTDLQTLPNIDINIKQGNSLLSRYPLTADLHEAFGKKGHSLQAYREAVLKYKHTNSKADKKQLVAFLEEIKQGFKTTLTNRDPLRKALSKLRGELAMLDNNIDLFGNKFKKEDDRVWEKKRLTKLLEQKEKEIEEIESNAIFQNAFEWRFEFPEVLDEEGRYRGFDVVIGNPPYIRQEELGDFKVYLKKNFSTFAGTADLYVYFVERGLNLLCEGGHFSYIVPNKWMRAGYGKALRQWLQNHTLVQLLDFGDLPVFEEATTYPLILAAAKFKPATTYTFDAATIATLQFEKGLTAYVYEQKYEVNAGLLSDSGWTLSNSTAQQLLDKLKNTGTPLGEYVEGKIYRGVLTGLNEAFVIDEATKERLIAEDPRSAEVIKTFLSGKGIKRYNAPLTNEYLIFTRRGITISDYPAIFNHLSKYKEKLIPKPKDWSGVKWDGRKPGPYQWYEIQDTVAYYEEFEKPKIIWPEVSYPNHFIIDENKHYINKTSFTIPLNDYYLLGILNSKYAFYFLINICSAMRGGYLMLSKQHVENLPIATPDEETKASITRLVEQILQIKQDDVAADTSGLEAEIDLLVYRLYNLTYEEVLLIEPDFTLSKEAYNKTELQNVLTI
jgi:adenine-specific DNA-methyltransferase